MDYLQFKLNLRYLCIVLLAIIAVMLAVWQPWKLGVKAKTISVSGTANVEKAPDFFVFNPTYTSQGAEGSEAIKKVTAIGNEVVAKLKQLGLSDDQITTNVSASPDYRALKGDDAVLGSPTPANTGATYQITAKAKDKDLARRVLEYLVTTPLQSSVTPQSEFSRETRRTLELEARKQAVADARRKAETTAAELGVKLGKVVSVSEAGGGIYPVLQGKSSGQALDMAMPSPPELQTGLQEISFTITAEFEIR